MSTKVSQPMPTPLRPKPGNMPKLKPMQRYQSLPALGTGMQKSPRMSVMKRKDRVNTNVTTSVGSQIVSGKDRPVSLYLSRTTSVLNATIEEDEVFEESDHVTNTDTEPSSPNSVDNDQTSLNSNRVIPPIQKEFTFTGYDIMADDESGSTTSDSDNERQTNVQRYIDACKMLGLYPVTSVCKQMNNSHVAIKSHPLGPLGARAICIALVNNTRVEALDLNDNDIGVKGVTAIVEMLKDNQNITEMRLCDNCIGSKGAELFANLVDTGRHLHTLDMSGNDLDDSDAKHIAFIMENSHLLKVLAVGHNKLSNHGAFDIGRALAINDTLQELDLRWNHIRGRGTIAIAIGLQKNVALKRLNLAWNGFAKEGSVGLARALSENRTLLELDVANNRIGPKGIVAILKGLQKNEGLTTLRIGQNPYSPEVAKSILAAIADSACVLRTLDLSNIVVRKDFIEKWDEIKRKRPIPLRVVTGPIIESKTKVDTERDGIDWRDPVTRMFGFMQEMGYRCIDLLKRLDKDRSLSVDRAEFKQGMHSINLPVTESQLDTILDKLDADGDGEVDFGELLSGEREFKRKLRLRKKRMLKLTNMAEDAIERLLKIDEL